MTEPDFEAELNMVIQSALGVCQRAAEWSLGELIDASRVSWDALGSSEDRAGIEQAARAFCYWDAAVRQYQKLLDRHSTLTIVKEEEE